MSMHKGLKEAQEATKKLIESIGGKRVEAALTGAAGIGRARGLTLTPMALGTLVNSQFMEVVPTDKGWRARIGFTAEYAAWVHKAPGTLKGKNVKRPIPGTGNVWDPEAVPHFLRVGFEETRDIMKEAFDDGMTL